MEMEKMGEMDSSATKDDDDVPLPGFRFHPTDEELVGFYLRRKVEKRPVRIELITQIDIYKYDPWDLPKAGNVRDKEWYFFCKRGRKYRNSVRPNRVTGSGSGFWKATGIDRPIYSASSTGIGGGGEDRRECIGLKKSLVYYCGSAGKGTKTDWMMHEFRLPADHDDTNITQEAEVWTLCRIFKRNVTYKKCIPDWRELYAAKRNPNPAVLDASSKTCSVAESDSHEGYISFSGAPVIRQNEKKNKQFVNNDNVVDETKQMIYQSSSSYTSQALPCPSTALTYSSFTSPVVVDANELIKYDDWDELRSVVEFAVVDDPLFPYVNNNM